MQLCFYSVYYFSSCFTAIGTTAAIGNKELVRMTNPYTFLYIGPEKDKVVDKHLSIIKNILLMRIFHIEQLHLLINIQKVMYM